MLQKGNDDYYLDEINKIPAKGISKEDSVKEHSSEMFDFCNLDHIAHHLCAFFINNHLLESFASDVPEDSKVSSSSSNLSGDS